MRVSITREGEGWYMYYRERERVGRGLVLWGGRGLALRVREKIGNIGGEVRVSTTSFNP